MENVERVGDKLEVTNKRSVNYPGPIIYSL